MSGTDITNLLDIVQRKINAVDSSASTSDLLYLLSAIRQSGEGSVFAYDNESQIPNLLDGTPDPEMIAYTLDSDKLYFQRGSWVGKAPPIRPFQGSNYGYTSGGNAPQLSEPNNVIDKFPFASDANATDVGDLTLARADLAGQSSATHGYASGGSYPAKSVIDKFPFSAVANATDVGDLTVSRYGPAGQSSIVNGFGYTSGGNEATDTGQVNVIDKFPFSSDANATDVGDLTVARERGSTGHSSTTHGYFAGGYTPSSVIDKFSFATDGNATDAGDLSTGRYWAAGQSSTTHGYVSGRTGNNVTEYIEKFPFASDFTGTATDIGDLSNGRNGVTGQSSTASGYISGGRDPALSNVIDKFPFASDFTGNATDVGDLTVARKMAAGQQY
jgi:hypothetical protein